jgi:hypothetical protein
MKIKKYSPKGLFTLVGKTKELCKMALKFVFLVYILIIYLFFSAPFWNSLIMGAHKWLGHQTDTKINET